MIKFFRHIRKSLLQQNKTGKYFTYAIGEIVLVVIGILIALSINNWNQKQQEETQIRNIFARIIQDFNQSVKEIDRDVANMDYVQPVMVDIVNRDVNRDSLLTNNDYFRKYINSIRGYPDIKINDTGIRLLESKIELNYELNTKLTEKLISLYSEHLYEIEIDLSSLDNNFRILANYNNQKGVFTEYFIDKNRVPFTNMIFEDDSFRNYLYRYGNSFFIYKRNLKKFKTEGAVLIDEIKKVYNLE